MDKSRNIKVRGANESRRAEIIALFLSDVFHLHVLGFRQFRNGSNFGSSYFEYGKYINYLGVTFLKPSLGMRIALMDRKISTCGSLIRAGNFRSSGICATHATQIALRTLTREAVKLAQV